MLADLNAKMMHANKKNRYQSIMRNGIAIDIMYIYIMDSPGVSHVRNRKPSLFFECILAVILLTFRSESIPEPSTETCADASPAECHDLSNWPPCASMRSTAGSHVDCVRVNIQEKNTS